MAPLSAALQRILDVCETPLSMELDKVMVLDADSFGFLVDGTLRVLAACTEICTVLWDVFMKALIHNIKTYRQELARNFPFKHRAAVDGHHFLGLKAKACMVILEAPLDHHPCLGLHLCQKPLSLTGEVCSTSMAD